MKKQARNEYNLTKQEIMDSISDLRSLTLDFIVRESMNRQTAPKADSYNRDYKRDYGIN